MSKPDNEPSQQRRTFFKRVAVIPIAAAGGAGALVAQNSVSAAPEAAKPYSPSFFSKDEWDFLIAACNRLIPKDEHGPSAVELGVPEFLDRHMQTPYAAGNIWYTKGPYIEASAHFGYQGRLVLRDILRVGIKACDEFCATNFSGKKFAALDAKQQDEFLKNAEAGKLKLDAVPEKVFFTNLLNEVRNGYFSDPKHGGNKGMGSWKMIGYPGMRADYMDWVEVRDKAYPIGPVDLAGRRG